MQEIRRTLKSRDLTSRDLTKRHQIKQTCQRTVEQRGSRVEQCANDGPRTKICHSVKYSTTCGALHPPQDGIFRSLTSKQLPVGLCSLQTTSSRTPGAANVFHRSRLCTAVSSSRYAQLEDRDFCRGVADAGYIAQLELLSSAVL